MTVTTISGTTSTSLSATSSGSEILVISSGATISATVGNGGYELVSGGTTTATLINDQGEELVGGGGLASFTTVSGGGYLTVSNGGASVSATVENWAAEYVLNATATATRVLSGGTVIVANGGVVSGLVESAGAQLLSTGVAVLSNNGASFASSAGTMSGTVVSTYLSQLVLSGGTATSAVVKGTSAFQVAYSGGTLIGTVVSSGGFAILSGGTGSGITVSNHGTATVDDGSTAVNVLVDSGGYLTLSNGATISAAISAGGFELVSGGTTSATQILYLGEELVGSQAVASNSVVSSGGYLTVSNGGLSVSATISSGAAEYVVNGTATDTTALSGATVIVANGGVLNGLVQSAGVQLLSTGVIVLSNDGASFVSSAAAMSGTLVSTYLNQVVLAGGVATNAVVEGTSAYQVAYSGGIVSGTVVSSGGFAILSGGTGSGITVSSGGKLVIDAGGLAVSAIAGSGSYLLISTGGTVSYGSAYNLLDSGGSGANLSAFSATVYSGGVIENASIHTLGISSGGVGIGVSGGTIFVYSGGQMVSATGQTVSVESGGIASDTIMSSGGSLTVYAGGKLVNATLSGPGSTLIDGVSISTTLAARYETVAAGGVTSNGIISSGGIQTINTSGIASNTIINSGGLQTVMGVSTDAIISGGGMQWVQSEGTASNTIVSSGGQQFLSETNDGQSVSTTILNGGQEIVAGVNSAIASVISSGGELFLYSGGLASGTTLLSGGMIELHVLSYVSSGLGAYNAGSNTVTITEGGSATTLTLSGSYAGEAFRVTADGTGGTLVTLACYAAGTRIATPGGEVAIEALREGDLVRTLEGEARAITWLGHRRVNCAAHPKPEDVWPIRIRAHAFAPGRPHRDVLVSPEHAVFVDGFLMPASALVNGASIVQERVESIIWWHLELATHDVLLAEGLPAESYLDTGNRDSFENAGKTVALHPRFGRQGHTALAYAPFADTGWPVRHARAALQARLPELGFAAAETGWWIEADGAVLPVVDGGWQVPAGAVVRIRSAAWRPMDMEPGSTDTRALGLCLGGIAIDGQALALDEARLADGFHPVESDGAAIWRWTDGAALLPAELFADGAVLSLDVIRAPLGWATNEAFAATA